MTGKRILLCLLGTIVMGAVLYFGLAVVLSPGDVGPPPALPLLEYVERLEAARSLRAAGKLDEAEAALHRILEDYRGNKEIADSIFETNFELAAVYEQRNELEQAQEQYRIIIESGGPDMVVRARLKRAQMLAAAGDAGLQELAALYEEFKNTPEVGGRVCVKLADELLKRRRYSEAVEVLAETLQGKLTTNATCLDRMHEQMSEALSAWAEQASGPVEQAEVYLQQVRRHPKMVGMCWSWLEKAGLLYVKAGEFGKARNAFNEIVRDYPGDAGEQAKVGWLNLEKLDEAERAAATRLTAAGAAARVAAGEKVQLVSADIARDAVWSPDSGTYVVTGDVAVRKSAALVIKPGTRIEFCLGARLMVHGRLQARGTAAEPIVFTSAAEHPSFFDWEGVWFAECSGSLLENAVLRHARRGVVIRDSAPILSQVRITACGDAGIEESNGPGPGSGPPEFRQCEVIENPGNGIIVENSKAVISGGRIVGNGKSGLSIRNASQPVVTGTVIGGNGGNGIDCSDRSDAIIERVIITGNGGNGLLVMFSSPTVSECDIEHNAKAGCAWSSSSGGRISDCTIANNGGGVQCLIVSKPQVQGCVISDNRGYGVACESGSDPTITGNRFASLIGPAILVKDICRPTVKGNHFPPKGTAIRHEGDSPLDATDNVWPAGVSARRLVVQQVHDVGGKVLLP